MEIEQIRHATMTITYREYKILVDPMFSKKNTMYSLQTRELLHLKKKNPMVDLPDDMDKRMRGVTHVLLTHNHFDHLDKPAIEYIKSKNLEVFCTANDEEALRKIGLKTFPLKEGEDNRVLGGTVKVVRGRHGWGWIAKPMGYSAGYIIEIPDEPTLYIAGDTVLTEEVRRAVSEARADWTILAAGMAKLGVGRPLLMDEDEILEVAELSHGKVILNHMEVMDHCLIDRKRARELMLKNNLIQKVMIPDDGEVIKCE